MKRAPVQSSSIASVGYDAGALVLEIEFVKGSVYQYFEVPPEVFDELMTADSIGRYHAKRIVGKYDYVQAER